MRRRPLLILFLVVFVDLVGFGIVLPLLPLYAYELDAGGLEVGLLFACFSLAQLLAAPALGTLSDRVGRRPVLIASLAIGAASYVAFGLSESLWQLFVARAVAGLCGGNLSTAYAYVADVSSLEDRASAMGLIGAAMGLGFVLGPAIGGLFAEISLSAPFFFAAILSGLSAALCLTWLPEPEERSAATERKGSLSMLRDGRIGRPIGCVFISMLAFTHLETVFALYNTSRFDLTASQNALLFVVIGVVLVAVQAGPIGPISRRLGITTTLRLGVMMMAVGLIATPLAHTVPLLVLALVPTAAGAGLTAPLLLTLISASAKDGCQGQTQGLRQSASSLARLVGPLSAGLLYDYVSHGSAFLVAGTAVLFVLLLVRPSGQYAGGQGRHHQLASSPRALDKKHSGRVD